MSDVTVAFHASLQKVGQAVPKLHKFDVNALDHFLQEAYSINARINDLTRELRSIRPAYLSTANPTRRRTAGHDQSDRSRPLTDGERDAIDAQSKQLLRQLNGAIGALKQAEEVRNQTAESVALSKRAKGGLGAVGRWAAGGAITAKSPEEEQEEATRKTLAAHREGIITYLQKRLEEAGRAQSEMMEIRLNREIEKSKSALYKSRVTGGIPYVQDEQTTARTQSVHDNSSAEQDPGSDPGPTPEQQQAFAQENADMVKYYEGQLDQVRTAERSILEISELHATLHANLEQQSDHIETLIQDSFTTTENVGKGNKELKRASERKSTAQALFYSTVAFCSFLVIWDLVF